MAQNARGGRPDFQSGVSGFDTRLRYQIMVVEVLMDTCWIVNPELRARYPSITPEFVVDGLYCGICPRMR